MSIKRKILINSASNFLSRFGINILSFFTLPVFIKQFGSSQYAIFILINTIVESVVFFDFGIGTSLGKKASEFTINQTQQKFTLYFNWTFWFTLIFSIICSGILLLFAGSFTRLFKVDPQYFDDGVMAFRLAAIYLLLYFVLKIYQTVLEGFEKFVMVNIFRVFQYISLILAVLLALYGHLSFKHFLLISIAGNLLPYICYAIYFHNRYQMQIRFEIGIKGLFTSDFWSMSKNFFVIQITSFLFSMADKFIISFIIGATSVVYYTVVTKISYIVRMVNNQTLLVINPMIAKARESNDFVLLGKIVKQGAVYQFILMLPIITTAALFLRAFLTLWIGGEYIAYAHWGVLALVIYLLGPFSGMVQRVLIYGGFEGVVKNLTLKLVILNVVTSIAFTYLLGIGGVIIGSVIQALISIPVFKQKAKELLHMEYKLFNRETNISILISVVFIAVFYLLHIEKRAATWPAFLVWSFLFFTLQMLMPAYKVFIQKKS